MISTAAPVSHVGFDVSMPSRGAVARFARRAIDAIAVARMEKALGMFSDDALARLGLARADIPAHAARLMRRG